MKPEVAERLKVLAREAEALSKLYAKSEGPWPGIEHAFRKGLPCCSFGLLLSNCGFQAKNIKDNDRALRRYLKATPSDELLGLVENIAVKNDGALSDKRRETVAPLLKVLAEEIRESLE